MEKFTYALDNSPFSSVSTMPQTASRNWRIHNSSMARACAKLDKAHPSPLIETKSEEPEGKGSFVNSQFTKSEGTPAKEPVTVVMKEREICPNCGLGLDFPEEVLINDKPVKLCMDCADEFKQTGTLSMLNLNEGKP